MITQPASFFENIKATYWLEQVHRENIIYSTFLYSRIIKLEVPREICTFVVLVKLDYVENITEIL